MSLFLKIFLWFWGAMTILTLTLVMVLSPMLEGNIVSRPGSIESALAYANNSVAVYEKGGDAKLREYLRPKQRDGMKVFLFDPQNRARGLKIGEHVPDDVQVFARDTQLGTRSGGVPSPQYQYSFSRIAISQPVPTPGGYYVFIGSISRPALSRHINTRAAVITILSGFITIGLFCYGLARYLAAPVSRIRSAAQRISSGDLGARVQPNHIPRGRDEIAYLARDFDTMAGRLQNLVTAQNRLLGDVSHELRSPLARMNLALELARRGDETKRQNALERIERESARLDVLVGELLTLSRLENGLRAETLNNAVDIAQLTREVAEDAEFEAQNAGRGVEVEFCGPEKSLIVRGDPELLRRAVENVTRNALRHTNDNSKVSLELGSENGEVVLSIADCGPGVPDEELDSIFRPFYRVEGARDRPDGSSGTGLGLAIAQRAIFAHGGTISASNRPGAGLMVRLSLPENRANLKGEKSLSATG